MLIKRNFCFAKKKSRKNLKYIFILPKKVWKKNSGTSSYEKTLDYGKCCREILFTYTLKFFGVFLLFWRLVKKIQTVISSVKVI